jgi:hypothetical protein
MLEASIDGQRSGSEVYFVKVYPEGMSDHGRPIDYAGRVNADATEIEGTWTVRGAWSGRFLMIRSGRQQQAKTRRARRSVPVS